MDSLSMEEFLSDDNLLVRSHILPGRTWDQSCVNTRSQDDNKIVERARVEIADTFGIPLDELSLILDRQNQKVTGSK